MLTNDPKPGTKVIALTTIRKGLRTLEAHETATIYKQGGYEVESAADLFDVEYRGEIFSLRRDQLRDG